MFKLIAAIQSIAQTLFLTRRYNTEERSGNLHRLALSRALGSV